jgi:CheY-like chemotaxis protein/chromosome segregation ATPase
MAKASQKITEFPGMADLPDPVAALPADFLSQGRDPTREIGNLIETLQATARDARRRQRQAEEECEQLRTQMLDLEERIESSPKDNGQMKSLIRERDMLVEQQAQYGPAISDLKQRLKRAESEIREANDERDTAVREKKNLNRQIEDSEKQRAEAFRQRESANRQRDLFKGERDEALEKAALHRKNFTDAQKAIAEAQKALAETRQELAAAKKKGGSELGTQLDSLRQARDGMSAQVAELKQRVSDLEDENAEAGYAREAAERLAQECQAQLADIKGVLEATASGTDAQRVEQLEGAIIELQSQLAAAQEAGETISEDEANLSAELASIRIATDAAVLEGAGHAALIGEANASLAAAQAQIEFLSHERDALREEIAQRKAEFEAQLNEQAAEVERFAMAIHQSENTAAQRGRPEALFEERRLGMIDLNAKLENAQREIRELSAKLAEARLLAKRTKRPASPAVARNPDAHDAPEEALAALCRSHQMFTADHQQPGVLSEMESHTRTVLDHAAKNGRAILQHACTVLANLIGDLMEIPDAIGQHMVRTLDQGIEFIALLLSDPEIEKRIRLDDVCVYIVDDDPDSCATAMDALGLVGIRAEQSRNSGNAIVELSSMQCDLILLDVHLPELDGFDLAEQIRAMEQHSGTPIFFVTGDGSLDTRTKSTMHTASDFIRKPYSIQELALKSLRTVVTGQLRKRG